MCEIMPDLAVLTAGNAALFCHALQYFSLFRIMAVSEHSGGFYDEGQRDPDEYAPAREQSKL